MSDSEIASVDGGESAEQELEESEDCLKGWTKEDKFHLLVGLKSYGSNSIEDGTVTSNIVPGKDETQVKAAINFYRRKTAETFSSVVNPKRKKKVCNQSTITNKTVPLSSWAKILTDTFPFKELQTETGTALRLIANYENIPTVNHTGGINFRDLYLTMADAIEGKTLPKDVDIMGVMQKCLLETAFDSRTFMKQSTLQMVLDNINFNNKEERHVFSRPGTDSERVILRHLATNNSYNPFDIPEDCLKPTKSLQNELDFN